jgi:hypothetical protein
MATPTEKKLKLMIYKTFIDNEKFQLAEILRRHTEEEYIYPEAMDGPAAEQLDKYLKVLKDAMAECDVLRAEITHVLNNLE